MFDEKGDGKRGMMLTIIMVAVGKTANYYLPSTSIGICNDVCIVLLRGTLVNRTYGIHRNLYI